MLGELREIRYVHREKVRTGKTALRPAHDWERPARNLVQEIDGIGNVLRRILNVVEHVGLYTVIGDLDLQLISWQASLQVERRSKRRIPDRLRRGPAASCSLGPSSEYRLCRLHGCMSVIRA